LIKECCCPMHLFFCNDTELFQTHNKENDRASLTFSTDIFESLQARTDKSEQDRNEPINNYPHQFEIKAILFRTLV
jgi:hypothetical protein